jgi:ubiquinone biosynthesis protein COQ4
MSESAVSASPQASRSDADLLRVAQPPPRRKVEWKTAWQALRSLIDDPERTDQVFVLIEALAGNSGERLFQRFLRHPDARTLLCEKPSLLATLSDRKRLEEMPDGSFGREYARFMSEGGIEPEGLVEASEDRERIHEDVADPERDWFFTRLRDMHDLWHVLTGYGRDLAGEDANLAFTYAQTRNRGIGAIVLASLVIGPKTLDLFWPRYLFRAWRRGRGASLLAAARYEELLPLPLEEVRQRLAVAPASEAHPGGILVWNMGDDAIAVAR